jgi:hypothetical protein
MIERVQSIQFNGIYNDAGAEADAVAVVGKRRIRYDATLRFSGGLESRKPKSS